MIMSERVFEPDYSDPPSYSDSEPSDSEVVVENDLRMELLMLKEAGVHRRKRSINIPLTVIVIVMLIC